MPMHFDDAAAERLEAIYLGHDVVAQRKHTLRLLDLKRGERVIDIGSGPGFLCQEMAEAVGPEGAVRGVDLSADLLRRAEARKTHSWVSYAEGDATALDEPDGAYDVVVSVQVAEYVPDIDAFCAEVFRVMRPGGRGLIVATDWNAIAWHSADPDRVRRILDAFEPHCANSTLPRTLAPTLSKAGLEIDDVTGFPIINTAGDPKDYSVGMRNFIISYVRNGGSVPEADIQAFDDEQAELIRTGDYYFATTRVIFRVSRPA